MRQPTPPPARYLTGYSHRSTPPIRTTSNSIRYILSAKLFITTSLTQPLSTSFLVERLLLRLYTNAMLCLAGLKHFDYAFYGSYSRCGEKSSDIYHMVWTCPSNPLHPLSPTQPGRTGRRPCLAVLTFRPKMSWWDEPKRRPMSMGSRTRDLHLVFVRAAPLRGSLHTSTEFSMIQ